MIIACFRDGLLSKRVRSGEKVCRGFWREEGGGGWAWVTESSGVGLVILMIDSGEQMYLNFHSSSHLY